MTHVEAFKTSGTSPPASDQAIRNGMGKVVGWVCPNCRGWTIRSGPDKLHIIECPTCSGQGWIKHLNSAQKIHTPR